MNRVPVLNAFQRVRPRANAAAPAAAARQRRHQPAKVLVLDVNGKPMATLAPRRYGSPAILSRAQSQAQSDKTRAIVRGGI